MGNLRKKYVNIVAFLLTIMLLSQLNTFQIVQASETQLAPYVTEEMATAEYWINKKSGAYDLLMTEEEIKELNEKILKTKETCMNDLKNLPETFNGVEMAESISNFESPKGYYINKKPVKEEYYEEIRKNIKNSNVTENMKVKYAFAVNETLMKAYPYSDFISDSIDDVEWDQFTNSSVTVNEPLVVYFITSDKKYALVKNKTCSGFVLLEDIAICKDKTEWLKAQDMKNILCVIGEKIYLEASTADSGNSQKMLPMGTVLEMDENYTDSISNRIPWNNYVVLMPSRNPDGYFYQRRVMIPANRDVVKGYLPLTSAGIINQAFKLIGNRYGWGGMLHSQDCSSMVKDVYRCFGLELPRNTTWQAAMPVKTMDLSNMDTKEKYKTLCQLTPGSIVQFPGHEMIFLGEDNGKLYTINNVSSMADPQNTSSVLRVRGVIVNDLLSTKRKTGVTWFTALDKTIEVWE